MKAAFLLIALFALSACAKSYDPAEVIKCVLQDEKIFTDLAKLVEAVASGDVSKIFPVILEIYPDIVAVIQRCFSGLTLKQGWEEIVIPILVSVFGKIVYEWVKQGTTYLYNMCKEQYGQPICELIPH